MTERLRETLIDLQKNKPIKAFRRLKSGKKPSNLLVFGITRSVRRSWGGARKDSALEDVRFHDLRHSTGTRLSEVLPVVHVGQLLGHRNPKTTNRYINPDYEVLVRAASVLEEWQEMHRLAAKKKNEIATEGGRELNFAS